MSSPVIALFMGPPGSGKGTLSERCMKELGWYQLSTGNLLRKHISEQTDLGKQIDFIIKSGKLVSDELINAMVKQWLLDLRQKNPQGIILDGYPRTRAQAKALSELLRDVFGDIPLRAVRLCIDDQVAVDRMTSRLVCQNKECQAVYSLMTNSSMRPKDPTKCDKCGSPIGKRKDDEVAVIKDRIDTYNKHEKHLLDFYDEIGLPVIECNAQQSVGNLFSEFKTLMNIH